MSNVRPFTRMATKVVNRMSINRRLLSAEERACSLRRFRVACRFRPLSVASARELQPRHRSPFLAGSRKRSYRSCAGTGRKYAVKTTLAKFEAARRWQLSPVAPGNAQKPRSVQLTHVPNPAIELTRSGRARSAVISFSAKPALPPRAAHGER